MLFMMSHLVTPASIPVKDPTTGLFRATKVDPAFIAAAKECAGLEREEFLAELERRLVARFAAETIPDTPRHDGAPV